MTEAVPGGQLLTFAVTDAVGSTSLYHRYPADMPAAMDLHDQILAAAIRRHHGNPFKNTGDGVFAVFVRPLDAVLAMIDAQRDLRAANWGPTGRLQIRCGIHTGLARPRGNDYFGPALAAVSRLEGAASADQVLVSQSIRDGLAAETSAIPCEFLDLGEHHFKGIEGIRVHQLCTTDLPRTFPPIGGKRETASGNLPANLSSFVGRERELDELVELTHESRLITLIGPGGIGKTRLAIELAGRLEPAFADGAWLVDLTSIERGGNVWPALAEALLIEPQAGVEIRSQVIQRLRKARAILLIDNCEHVLDQIADAISDLGAACRELFMINTSRRTLGVDGEALYEVNALNANAAPGTGQSAAVRLFVARARLTDHRFQPTPADLRAIQTVCDNLENIPLAIEIAVGHLRRVNLAQLASGFVKPLELRSSGSQRRSHRQQTLRQTLQWSYDLLSPNSRDLLQRLAVFSGAFREDQALALCVGGDVEESDILDGIDDLVDSSLLAREPGGNQRLKMLQTVQAFGREQLSSAGRLESVEHRHAEVFAERSRTLGAQLATDKEAEAVNTIYEEMPNLRMAFERALITDLGLAATMASNLFLFSYSHRGAETAGWYRRIAALPEADSLEQAPLVFAGAAGEAYHSVGDTKAASAYLQRGFKAEEMGIGSSRGWLSGVAGQVAQWSRNEEKCLQYLSASIEQARREGDFYCEITALCLAANANVLGRNHEVALELVTLASNLCRSVNCPTTLAYLHFARGRVASLVSHAQAVNEYRIGVDWAEMAGNHEGAVRIKFFLADSRALSAEPPQAILILVQMLTEMPDDGAAYFFYAWSLVRSLILPLARLGADQCLAVLSGALEASPVKIRRSSERTAIEAARTRLGPELFDRLKATGVQFDQSEARNYCIDTVAREARQAELNNAEFSEIPRL
jgi:predicted ATPase/class 3 adenylate cyclase